MQTSAQKVKHNLEHVTIEGKTEVLTPVLTKVCVAFIQQLFLVFMLKFSEMG